MEAVDYETDQGGMEPGVRKKLFTAQYVQYLKSGEWQIKRYRVLCNAGFRCQSCGVHAKEREIEVHHKTYDRLGIEEMSDLIALCVPCHYDADKQRRKDSEQERHDRWENARINGYATKKYGEFWEDRFDADDIAVEAQEWIDSKDEDGY